MKTPVVIGVVVALHCAVLGTLVLTPGCGTPRSGGKPVQFQDKPAVLPPVTRDVMPEEVAKPRPKPALEAEDLFDEERFAQPARVGKEAVKADLEATKSYTIKRGDTLSHIAQWLKITMGEIRELNPGLKDASRIREGQVLKLPGYVNLNAPKPRKVSRPKPAVKAADKPAAGAAPAAASAGAAGGYVVVSGDYPGKIAKKFGVTVDDLMKANKITDPKKLRIGQKLVIPGAPAAPAPAPTMPLVPVEPAPIAPLVPTESGAFEPAAELNPIVPADAVAPAAPAADAAAPADLSSLAPAAPAAAAVAALKTPAVQQKHLVAPGETLKDVAMLYTVSVSDLMKANGLTNEAVASGQALLIPAQ